MDDVVSGLHTTITRLHMRMRGLELLKAIRQASEAQGLRFTSDEIVRLALPANRQTVNDLVTEALNRPSRKSAGELPAAPETPEAPEAAADETAAAETNQPQTGE